MQSNKNRLPAPVPHKPLRWELVPGCNIDVYTNGVKESNSKPDTYKYGYQLRVKMWDRDTLIVQSA